MTEPLVLTRVTCSPGIAGSLAFFFCQTSGDGGPIKLLVFRSLSEGIRLDRFLGPMGLFRKQSCCWHCRNSRLHTSWFLCSGSASGREASSPIRTLAAREPGKANIRQSAEFSAVRLGEEVQTLGSPNEQETFFRRGLCVFLLGYSLFPIWKQVVFRPVGKPLLV